MKRRAILAALLATFVAAGGCAERETRELPDQAALDSAYGARVAVSLSGNVVEARVRQDAEQLRRGGPIWAKAGPYIYLFTPQTQALFENYGGVGGVRVTTVDGRGELIARALLERGTLNSVTWQRAINVAGRARVDGTNRPQTMVDLTEFGEDNASYEYSQRYTRSD